MLMRGTRNNGIRISCMLIYWWTLARGMRKYTTEAFMVGLALLISLTGASAYAQFTEVSGVYTNAAAGVEITFPDGWSGAEIGAGGQLLVVTAPGGMGEAEVTKSITLITAEKSTDRDPRDPSSFSQESIDCNDPSVNSISVAGVQGYEAIVECPSTDTKMKMVSVGTTERWIVVMYLSPTSEFDSDVGKFDATVRSLTVLGAVDTEGIGELPDGDGGVSIGLTAITRTVVIAGADVDVEIRTNSTISQLALDVDNKRVSFTVDGETGTTGTTEIAIGKILEGPYTVTIGGQATTNFEVANEGSAEAVMTISYTHSEHDVVITGTNVVPEFPVAVIGVIAVIIGIVAIIGRTRLVTGYRQT